MSIVPGQTPAFFDAAPGITMQDALARTLGAVQDGVIEYRYLDAVKLCGHSCPTVAGAWLMTRAESVGASRRLRTLVPMSVIDEELEPTSLGSQVVGHLVDLPIGEGSPVVRLHQVSYALRAHSETGKAVAADRIAGVAGFAPTTFHALGSRVAMRETGGRSNINLVVTNVPGSQVRALAMLKGNIRATILDSTNKNFLLKEGGSKFTVLPLGNVKASDEALFARQEFLQKNQAAVAVLVEELLRVNRQINKDPASMLAERRSLGLLKDLPAKLEEEILPYFKEGVENGIFPDDGGGERAAKNDLEFFHLSGALKGPELKVESFWTFAPLQAALARLR